jgi:biofilm protein TabA
MILDHISHWRDYADFTGCFAPAFSFLEQVRDDIAAGRHDIDGESVFAIVVRNTPSPLADQPMESHRRYVDIQYIHRGREGMIWHPVDGLSADVMAYDESQDAALYTRPASVSPIAVLPGHFAAFFPRDAHLPSLAVGGEQPEVLKIVVKVRLP